MWQMFHDTACGIASEGYRWGLYQVLHYIKDLSMAPHSSTLAWKIPRAEEPGGLQYMGLLSRFSRVRLYATP